ncbi:MAG: acetate--CoA ligase [Candidatus Riflebacteria bacterium]|nr:acetate--CoA ligase [Candidatus Riflebacteria bacterium]
MTDSHKPLEDLLHENRHFPPSNEFVDQANANNSDIFNRGKNIESFWEGHAQEFQWFRKWEKVLEWDCPWAKWFVGATTNLSVNCLDRHIKSWRRNKAAFIWEGEPGEERVITYADLYRDVNKFANCLKSHGVKKGDRVTIYMGMIPELPIAMLACSRIGAIHSVIFGGFSVDSLIDRINDAQSKLVICSDGAFRRGNIIPLKRNIDEALKSCPCVEKVIIVRRIGEAAQFHTVEGRDLWWHRMMQEASPWCEPERMDSEDPLFILYTSGTTGKPKGIVHTTGGYMVGVGTTHKVVFDIKEEDVYWCTADIGWVTGHSYLVYGPLCNGSTNLMYEGAPDWPERDRFWSIIEKYRVSIFYTAPTAIRTFMRWGVEHINSYDLSSLRLLGTVGEPINPEAWMWYHENIGRGKTPIVDTWWQTETGHIMITPLPGITTTKPGSATKAFPGIEVDVVDEEGNTVKEGGGYLVIKKPWPGMLRTVWGNPDRYVQTYWSKFKNMYFTGDGCKRDKDGYLWLMGRVDDIMIVGGHNLSTTEVESALVDHHDVAEAAVIGRSDEITGQAIVAFVTLKLGVKGTQDKIEELKSHVARKIGPISRPKEIFFSADLPKTRSGKIMRRLLRDIAEKRNLGDTTTLADPSVIQALREKYEED